MPNVLESVWNGAFDSIKSPWNAIEDLSKGDFKGALNTVKHMPGNQERLNSKTLNSLGVRGWVGDHPGETAAAVVGSIFAAPYIAGASAAAGASSGTAATGASAGSGGVGIGAYMAPSTAGGVSASGSGIPLTLSGVSSSPSMALAPSTTSLISMGNAGVGASSATAGSSTFTPAMLTTQGASASGGTYGAASAPMEALGSTPSALSGGESSILSNSDGWNQISRLMNSVSKSGSQNNQLPTPQVQNAPMARSSFNFDGKNLQNPLLTKSYSELYTSPASASKIKI